MKEDGSDATIVPQGIINPFRLAKIKYNIGGQAFTIEQLQLVNELVEALEPFAKEADAWAEFVPDDHRSLCTEPGSEQAVFGSETEFTLGDLRRARALLSKFKGAA